MLINDVGIGKVIVNFDVGGEIMCDDVVIFIV